MSTPGVFVLTFDRMRRYEGAWHTERKPLFPECLFLEGSDKEEVEEKLRGCQNRMQEQKIEPESLSEEEQIFLQSLCGDGYHIGMSKGYIRNGETCVTEGPLRGKEGLIRKIDRHKRLAMIEIPGGAKRRMTAGLEIVSKS